MPSASSATQPALRDSTRSGVASPGASAGRIAGSTARSTSPLSFWLSKTFRASLRRCEGGDRRARGAMSCARKPRPSIRAMTLGQPRDVDPSRTRTRGRRVAREQSMPTSVTRTTVPQPLESFVGNSPRLRGREGRDASVARRPLRPEFALLNGPAILPLLWGFSFRDGGLRGHAWVTSQRM
jgi:hypothetical protein